MKNAACAKKANQNFPVDSAEVTFHRPRPPEATSFLMSRVRASNTRMEVKLRSTLHRKGYRFHKNVQALVGKPDIVFSRMRVAIFVDGDYWHARVLEESGIEALRQSLKTNNREFWIAKLQRNHERDIAVTAALEQIGWLVIRVWESDLKRRMNECVRAIVGAIESRRGHGAPPST